MKKKEGDLTCDMAQSMINGYIHDRLDLPETERFLHHMENCSECKEELWVYYTILTGMKKLDEEDNMNMDFTAELKRKIKKSEEKIFRHKRAILIKRIIFAVVIIACICLDVAVDTRTEPEQSNFELEYYFFKGRNSKLGAYADSHYNAMMEEKMRYRE